MFPPIYTTLKAASAVTAIVGTSPTKVYRHGSAPQDTAAPYVTWSIVAGVPENNLSDVPQIDRLPIQVDCWHTSDSGIEALATAVRNALEPVCHMTGIILDEREPETKLYRISLQFDYWLDR